MAYIEILKKFIFIYKSSFVLQVGMGIFGNILFRSYFDHQGVCRGRGMAVMEIMKISEDLWRWLYANKLKPVLWHYELDNLDT